MQIADRPEIHGKDLIAQASKTLSWDRRLLPQEKNMGTYTVCLTFDFDALSGFIARGLTTPTPISRGEFGVVASERILELLRRHQIPSTWFIPGHTIESFPDACRRVHAAGHEIAHHGWTHVPPANLNREQEEWNLVRGNEAIRMITGQAARGHPARPP
jgi:hypothetical protein